MKLPSEHIEDLDVKHHGIHLDGMRARSAERAAERALAHNPLLVVSAVAALVTMLFVPPSIAYLDYFNWHTLACLFSILAVKLPPSILQGCLNSSPIPWCSM